MDCIFTGEEINTADLVEWRVIDSPPARLEMKQPPVILISIGMALAGCVGAIAEAGTGHDSAAPAIRNDASAPVVIEPGMQVKKSDVCRLEKIEPNSPPLTWDSQAATTQCGALEIDELGIQQSLAGGSNQRLLVLTAKYGLTPNVEFRWGLPGRMKQSGGGSSRLVGTTDQWLGVCYRFQDQGRRLPALALDYAIKIPSANPAKGFGSGHTDHQLTFIASHDVGRNHFDFNVAGTIAGSPDGSDGAAQFGLALTRTITPNFNGTIEGFGGPQPGTSDRFGAALVGVALSIRPTVALQAAYAQTFTAGDSRSQLSIGFVYTLLPRLSLMPGSSKVGRLLGR